MITATIAFAAIFAVTALHLRFESRSSNLPMREWWKVGGYLNDIARDEYKKLN